MSCHVMSCHVMSCHVMSCHVMSCHVMSCHVMSCHVMSCDILSRNVHAIFNHGTKSNCIVVLLFCILYLSYVLRPLSFADRALATVNGPRHAWPCSCFTSELSCGALSLPEEGALSAVHVARVARGLLAHSTYTKNQSATTPTTNRWTRLLTTR